jgi:hypothetical protein
MVSYDMHAKCKVSGTFSEMWPVILDLCESKQWHQICLWSVMLMWAGSMTDILVLTYWRKIVQGDSSLAGSSSFGFALKMRSEVIRALWMVV